MVINGKWMKAAEKYKDDLGGFFLMQRRYQNLGKSDRTGMIK